MVVVLQKYDLYFLISTTVFLKKTVAVYRQLPGLCQALENKNLTRMLDYLCG